MTTDRASTRYLWSEIAGAVCHSTMSRGGSRPVSIQQRHGCPPRSSGGRQFEVERFPIRIHHQLNKQFLLLKLSSKRQAVRPIAPVRLIELHTVPGLACFPEQLIQALSLFLGLDVSQQTPSQ